jgi:hypothetical protein
MAEGERKLVLSLSSLAALVTMSAGLVIRSCAFSTGAVAQFYQSRLFFNCAGTNLNKWFWSEHQICTR